MGSLRCRRPGTSWGPREDLPTAGVRRICAVTGQGTSWMPCHSTRRGPTLFGGSRLTRAFITGREFRCSICSHKARQCACTHRNLQVTGEESIRNRIGTLRVAQQKTRFAAPRSYLVCPSSSSSIAPKASKGWLPEICRPLMKNVGVPVTPSWAPSIKSR